VQPFGTKRACDDRHVAISTCGGAIRGVCRAVETTHAPAAAALGGRVCWIAAQPHCNTSAPVAIIPRAPRLHNSTQPASIPTVSHSLTDVNHALCGNIAVNLRNDVNNITTKLKITKFIYAKR